MPPAPCPTPKPPDDMATAHDALSSVEQLPPRHMATLVDLNDSTSDADVKNDAGEASTSAQNSSIWWHGWAITVVASIVTPVSVAPMQSFAIGRTALTQQNPLTRLSFV